MNGNQTPYDYYYKKGGKELINMIAKEAYSKFDKFKGKKFVTSTEKYFKENDIQTRYLNDVRYLAVFLKEYLQPVCNDIVVSKGGFTAIIRKSLNLNKLLGNEFNKNRADYRHHMVDAFCTSIVSDEVLYIINQMNKEINKKTNTYKENEKKLKSYVKNVEKDFKNHFEKVITSHEVESKVKGELEEETLYGHNVIDLEDGSTLEKFFNHKPYEDVVAKYKTPLKLLEAHEKHNICLPKGLKKYLETQKKLPDIYTGWKRIKSYYNELAIRDNNGNIEGFRTVRNDLGKVIGYKKMDSKAYTIVYNDFSSESITKMEELNKKLTFDNVLYKLYRGDLLKSPEGEIYKIYQLPKGKVAIHPVNEIRIEGRDLKKYANGKVNSKTSSINVIFNKEKLYKIKVNILGHVI